MRAIFDLDDTICVHKHRDFDHALPVEKTVEKMRLLKNAGVYIIIYTARGQNSCGGDIALIKEKYENRIKKWLEIHNVPYDELIFGKPLGDLYVDDKGISLQEFHETVFEKLSGNSGSEIIRYGNTVNKKCKNAWEQADWYEYAKEHGINTPNVHSVVLDNITMDYIDGQITVLDRPVLSKMLATIFWMKEINDGSKFDVECLLKRVDEHLDDKKCTYRFGKLKAFLRENKDTLIANASFCHGDFSVSNCLMKDGSLYLIDPNQNKEYSSYLMDLAKLKFSMCKGQKFIGGNEVHITDADYIFFMSVLASHKILNVVRALEITHWLRLLKYTNDKEKVKDIIYIAIALEENL